MATPEKREEAKKIYPPVELPKCPQATPRPNPDDYGPMITITAGPAPGRNFYVHEGLLTHYSAYFKTALKDEWKEGANKMVKLEDDDAEVFRAFFQWLHTGKLYFVLDADGKIPLGFILICKIYVFGDARGIPDLCNAAIETLCQKVHQQWEFPSPVLNYVYENTLPGSPLRKFLVDFGADTHRFPLFADAQSRSTDDYPKEFFVDLTMNYMTLGSTPIRSSAGYGKNSFSKASWISYVKPQICGKYHDHSASTNSASSW